MKRTKYPAIEPNRTGFLSVSDQHTLYWEESGNPRGKPVVFLHGGPGAGTEPGHRCFFNPEVYQIILFDQRGCGKSVPHSHLVQNTTWDLVADIEKLREFLGIERWVVFGGSWGSTLALAYAETHPKRVVSLILRGIFLGRPKELRWFYQFGAHHLFPDQFDQFAAPIPPEERGDFIAAYFKRLTSSDPEVRSSAAKAWSGWEDATLRLVFDPAGRLFAEDIRADAIARIECHYFLNRCFFNTENWLLENVAPLCKIPGVIIQGRYDIVCPMESAWELHKAWPEADFQVIPDAGHASSEAGITHALIEATDRFAR
ncbi:MAG: prolyl aminopeptidase [Verrucomicrobiota bacterium]|nr:prolyl aminopeptidase [Verrucomicrobiota bacterium]